MPARFANLEIVVIALAGRDEERPIAVVAGVDRKAMPVRDRRLGKRVDQREARPLAALQDERRVRCIVVRGGALKMPGNRSPMPKARRPDCPAVSVSASPRGASRPRWPESPGIGRRCCRRLPVRQNESAMARDAEAIGTNRAAWRPSGPARRVHAAGGDGKDVRAMRAVVGMRTRQSLTAPPAAVEPILNPDPCAEGRAR